MRQLIHQDGEKIVRLSLPANHYIPLSDIDPDKKLAILEEAGVSEQELLHSNDLYQRVENEEDPLVRLMQASSLYKRVQVLKEADWQLREEYKIDPKKPEVILYFVIVGAGLEPKTVEKNQNAVMQIFGIEEQLARRSPLFGYGHASNWPNARDPQISKEPELVLRPIDGKIVVYDSKYKSRIDKVNGNISQSKGVIKKPGDLEHILRNNPMLIDPNTIYDKVYK